MIASANKTACSFCGSNDFEAALHFGPQPICNHYLPNPNAEELSFPRSILQCSQCALWQMASMVPYAELRSPFDWIRYEEAEGHLDHLVERILAVTGLQKDHLVLGLTYKDRTTLERFRKQGIEQVRLLDLADDLGTPSPCAGVESVQALLTESKALEFRNKYGAAQVIIARHILEHVHDIEEFRKAIHVLLAPGGFVVAEVPDFSIPLQTHDYCTIWEEHAYFFTPATLASSLPRIGFKVLELLNYPAALENTLVAISQPTLEPPPPLSPEIQSELEWGRNYAAAFPRMKEAIRRFLHATKQAGKEVAMFGAGHLACDFINLLNLADLVDFVVDDHPNKCGLYMPGSHLPIVKSAALLEHNIGICLLSVKPESEPFVVNKNAAFIANGGQFVSIFPNGPLSIQKRL